jgi:alpha-galactosidase
MLKNKEALMKKNIVKVLTQIDGNWLDSESPEVEIKLETRNEGHIWAKASFVNKSEKTIRFGGFRFDLEAFENIPGENIRIYREGWTMASACASVRFGEKDFESDPGYLKHAVSAPDQYDCKNPNNFSGEYAMVLNDSATGYSLLAGFVSSADQITRVTAKLEKSGLTEFRAFSSGDGMEVDPGERVESEELVVMDGDDGYSLLENFADLWGKRMNALTWDHVPTGWCTWYYYFSEVTENDVLENIEYLAKHKNEFPLEYIQLDDGYQAALGDWLTCNEKFPNGLEFLAGKVKEAGFKPGLWLAPFMVEEGSRLFADHPEWLVKDKEGQIIWSVDWRGSRTAVLDGTHPEAQEYLFNTFSTLVEWGIEYVKLDFMVFACIGEGGAYHDRKATRAQALRRGLAVIRKAMKDRFILGCTTPLGQVIGLVNGERIGTDITPYWKPDKKTYKEAPTVPNVCRNVINRCYMNGRLWISDPDTHIARIDNNKLTENETILWTFALYLTGGMMLLSDRFETLTPERQELSKLLLAEPGIFDSRPLDVFDREYPAVWLRRKKETGELLIGLFNLEDEAMELGFAADSIEKGSAYSITDFRSGEELGKDLKSFSMNVEPHSCRILTLS